MTVPSPSDDTNSSDDVYSSVPDTTSEKIETLDVKRFQNSKGDKFGPLPSVPNKYLNIKKTNANGYGLPNETKFNPFYLREMRRDGSRKQNIEPCNTGNIARSISPSCSACSVNSSKMPNCYRCNETGRVIKSL